MCSNGLHLGKKNINMGCYQIVLSSIRPNVIVEAWKRYQNQLSTLNTFWDMTWWRNKKRFEVIPPHTYQLRPMEIKACFFPFFCRSCVKRTQAGSDLEVKSRSANPASTPFIVRCLYSNLLYRMGHYFLDIKYKTVFKVLQFTVNIWIFL